MTTGQLRAEQGLDLQTSDDSLPDYELYHVPQPDEIADSNIDSDLNIDEQSNSNGSVNSDYDAETQVFPLCVERADNLCVKLDALIKAGVVQKDKILYKHLDDVTETLLNPYHEYDPEVVAFHDTIKFLGGNACAEFVKGAMWHGSGRGGCIGKQPENCKMNLGGPSKSTRAKQSSGYTTKSGVLKVWLESLLTLADEKHVVPLLETQTVKVHALALENDGTALKAGMEFDQQQHIIVGLKQRVNYPFIQQNPHPAPEFLRNSVVTESCVSFVTTADNSVSLPVSVNYKPKAGKTGENIRDQWLDEVNVVQTCITCLGRSISQDHIIGKEQVQHCRSTCNECLHLQDVCNQCRESQSSYIPSLRACQACLENGIKCVRGTVLVISADCEQSNKTAFEMIRAARESGDLAPQFIFAVMPDAVHVGKSLKASFANWAIFLNSERACLSILHTLRDVHPGLKKLLTRDAVMNKDRMDVDCILHLTNPSVLAILESLDHVVHTILPDKYKINASNKAGMYPHLVALTIGESGKLLVLDYKPTKETSRLLEVKMHVPAEVKVLKEVPKSLSVVYADHLVYICQHNDCITIYPEDGAKLQLNKLRKPDLQAECAKRGLDEHGSLRDMKQLLSAHLREVERDYKIQGHQIRVVALSEAVPPSCIGKASENMLVMASDQRRTFCTIVMSSNGVYVSGVVHALTEYPGYCMEVNSMCVSDNKVYVVYAGNPGGIIQVDLSTSEIHRIVDNNTIDCSECAGVAGYPGGIVFTDSGHHQLKLFDGEQITVVAGAGREGNDDGPAHTGTFAQPMGVCVEYGTNIFVADAQTGCVKLVTTVNGMIQFLHHLGLLYQAFSVHLKNKKVPKYSIDDAVEKVNTVLQYLQRTVYDVKTLTGTTKTTNGPEGTVSDKTIKSVDMIHKELQHMGEVLQFVNPQFTVDLHSCLTVQVENLHAVGHFKTDLPTMLQYARNLANTVHESMKRVVPWAANYFTHPSSYYPVPDFDMKFDSIPKLEHLKPHTVLSKRQQADMQTWAVEHGKCVRQKSVRQETTKFKMGTLPLNMYKSSNLCMEKITLNHRMAAEDVLQPNRLHQGNDGPENPEVIPELLENVEPNVDPDVQVALESDQHSEYDTDSSPEADELEEPPACLFFMKGITTRSGRAVKVPNYN